MLQMRAPRSIIGTISRTPSGRRRLILTVLAIIFALLAYFPERYRSAATLAPSDPNSYGLGSAVSQVGAANSVFGNQAAVEITIRVARSLFVGNVVIDRLKLMDRLDFKNRVEAHRW